MPPGKMKSTRGGFVERANLTMAEFIVLAATLSAIGAMSIDIMLPLLPEIGASFQISDENDRQLVVVAFSLALAVGQLVFAPLSDRFGRRPLLIFGVGLYMASAAGCAVSGRFEWLLFLRFTQGLGASTIRSVVMAMVRDCFAGDAMGRVLNFVFTGFMLIPMAAPFVGQFIGRLWGWHAIFWCLAGISLLMGLWITIRLRETLPQEQRHTLSPRALLISFREVLFNRLTLGYTAAAALSFTGLLAFILSCQQIYGELYALGDLFPLAFASGAIFSAIALLSSARLIRTFGTRFIVHTALAASAVFGFVLLFASFGGKPPFILTFISLNISLASASILQGNTNAIALEPLGHVAGLASAVVGFISMTVGVLLAGVVGQLYNGTVQPLAFVTGAGSLLALAVIAWAEHGKLFSIKPKS